MRPCMCAHQRPSLYVILFPQRTDVSAIGWGDAHELGHNMQAPQFETYYGANANGDDYSAYTHDSTSEASCNIFPYYILYHYYRNFHNYSGTEVSDDHMRGIVGTPLLSAAGLLLVGTVLG